MKNQSRQENIIYLVVWGILFAAPLLSLYIRTVNDTNIMFDWSEVFIVWRKFAVYLACSSTSTCAILFHRNSGYGCIHHLPMCHPSRHKKRWVYEAHTPANGATESTSTINWQSTSTIIRQSASTGIRQPSSTQIASRDAPTCFVGARHYVYCCTYPYVWG